MREKLDEAARALVDARYNVLEVVDTDDHCETLSKYQGRGWQEDDRILVYVYKSRQIYTLVTALHKHCIPSKNVVLLSGQRSLNKDLDCMEILSGYKISTVVEMQDWFKQDPTTVTKQKTGLMYMFLNSVQRAQRLYTLGQLKSTT